MLTLIQIGAPLPGTSIGGCFVLLLMFSAWLASAWVALTGFFALFFRCSKRHLRIVILICILSVVYRVLMLLLFIPPRIWPDEFILFGSTYGCAVVLIPLIWKYRMMSQDHGPVQLEPQS
jgi:hypothetical protein